MNNKFKKKKKITLLILIEIGMRGNFFYQLILNKLRNNKYFLINLNKKFLGIIILIKKE